ncbi:ATP-binding protein [Mesorhizobium sp. M0140]|uniref:ATP-binding protein n=1 Tax=Mesorhizobium sp. M0140 TaxID=2956893 RepID=UPI003338F6AE
MHLTNNTFDTLDTTLAKFSEHASPAPLVSKVLSDVKTALRELCPRAKSLSEAATLSEHVQAAIESIEGVRSAALLLIRCLGVPGALPDDDHRGGPHIQRKVIALVEKGTPDIANIIRMAERKLTFEKVDVLRSVHTRVVSLLEPLSKLPTNPSEFASRRQEVIKILKNDLLKAYLNPYGLAEVSNALREVQNSICQLLDVTGANFGQKLQEIVDTFEREKLNCGGRSNFLYNDVFAKFLDIVQSVISNIDRDSVGRFACVIRPKKATPQLLERRYPLHEPDRLVRVKIPIVNDGPGIAVETVAQFATNGNVLLGSEKIDIGTVPPGEVSINVEMLVGSQIKQLTIYTELSWRNARSAERQSISFDTVIAAQKVDIDWDELELSDPYSTEVAHGNEFVGRRRKVLALVNRFRKARMQSSYVTGQKRVGKTSLAFAVQDVLQGESAREEDISVIYLEYGDYARKDADGTVEALGDAIAERLLRDIPGEQRPANVNFSGTLAPLNQIAQKLLSLYPARKYLVVLDEFDEIHPEMYRFGALAEAFFSNLRTLSAKPNIALMLVGGENMPFIIGAQGDQLNKFVHEPLDYFSRSEEWDDFCELAKLNQLSPLTWHESALVQLFSYTNGHPYYTKLICARIFQNAIADRDAEVTADEVQRALPALITSLDTNAFAHFWKDGIASGREEAEVTALKRCRVLVAIARARRRGLALTSENIVECRATTALPSGEIVPLLTDFCRREILREKGREYEFVLPIFEQWLVANGMSKLVTDTLGDDMADALQSAEDQAFVSPPEIAKLVESWPTYRGRRVTSEDVRGWIQQRHSFQEQRLLFKLLQNVRFVSEEEIREKLRTAHSLVKRHTSAFTPESRAHRRYDIVVSYVDGSAKSGSRYADRYAEENLISTTSVFGSEGFSQWISEYEEKRGITVNGIVVIDDIAATGAGLSANVEKFVHLNAQFLKDRSITVVVVTLLATREADGRLRESLSKMHGVDIDFRTCEVLEDRHFAFRPNNGIWEDQTEADRAKDLVTTLGREIYKNDPLGFGDLGLLVVFNDTCPNNSLPILHAGKTPTWNPLFERPKN